MIKLVFRIILSLLVVVAAMYVTHQAQIAFLKAIHPINYWWAYAIIYAAILVSALMFLMVIDLVFNESDKFNVRGY